MPFLTMTVSIHFMTQDFVCEWIHLAFIGCTQQELAAVGLLGYWIFFLHSASLIACFLQIWLVCIDLLRPVPSLHALLLFGARLNSEMLWPPAVIPVATISNKCLLVFFLGFPPNTLGNWDLVTLNEICSWPSEKAMAPHSSTLAWKIPWMEEPGRLQFMGSLRVGHDWATSLSLLTFLHWRRKWQPTPVFLPGESQGWGSLVGCRLWGCTESDTTEMT